MKKVLFASLLLLLSLSSLQALAAEPKFGSVDMQKILLLSDAGKDAK